MVGHFLNGNSVIDAISYTVFCTVSTHSDTATSVCATVLLEQMASLPAPTAAGSFWTTSLPLALLVYTQTEFCISNNTSNKIKSLNTRLNA